MKILKIAISLVGLLAFGLGIAWAATAPAPLPADTRSAERLAPGPFDVERSEWTWVDESRPTASNGRFEGAPERTSRTVETRTLKRKMISPSNITKGEGKSRYR